MSASLGAIFAFISGIAFGLSYAWSKTEEKEFVIEYRDISTLKETSLANAPGPPLVEIVDEEQIESYHNVAAPYAPTKAFKSDFYFISHEDFLDEEEHDKIEIEVFRDGDEDYIIMVDGAPIEKYALLDDEVLAELIGKESLFLRNDIKKEDYEVVWGKP